MVRLARDGLYNGVVDFFNAASEPVTYSNEIATLTMLYQAPLAAFIIFASEKVSSIGECISTTTADLMCDIPNQDIWSVWCFWRRLKDDDMPPSGAPEAKVTRTAPQWRMGGCWHPRFT